MTKEEIKETYSMLDILMRYGITVNRAGFARCPFHNEKTASMKVYKDSYNCFGCGASGDVFSLVMHMEQLGFKEAFLALGGHYEDKKETVYQKMKRRIEFEKKKNKRLVIESEFKEWKNKRLTEICNVLQLCDNAEQEKLYEKFKDEWAFLEEMKQQHEYKYSILTNGTREEQEAMRKLNE